MKKIRDSSTVLGMTEWWLGMIHFFYPDGMRMKSPFLSSGTKGVKRTKLKDLCNEILTPLVCCLLSISLGILALGGMATMCRLLRKLAFPHIDRLGMTNSSSEG